MRFFASGRENSPTAAIVDFARYLIAEGGTRRTVFGIALLIFGSLTEGISILLLVPLLQQIGPDRESIAIPVPTSGLAMIFGTHVYIALPAILAAVVALVLARAIFIRFSNLFLSALLYDVINEVRLGLFRSISGAKWEAVARYRGADLNHVLTADIDRVQSAAMHLYLMLQSIVLLVVYLFASWLISPAMTTFAFAAGGVMLAALHGVRKRAADYGEKLTRNRQAQYRLISEFLGGVKVAKAFNAEPRYLSELAGTLGSMRSDYMRFVRIGSMGSLATQVASALVLAFFVYVALGEFALSLPKIVVLAFLFLRIAPRFTGLQSHMQEVLVNLPAFDAMQTTRTMCDMAREHQAPSEICPIVLKRCLRLEGVCLRYGGDEDESGLDEVSLSVPAGKVTAIVGPSGSGKSTIADVMMGLLEPTTGTVVVDGVALDESNRRSWREHVGYVPQDVFLLHDTIEANLRLAEPRASEDEIWGALRAANADAFVGELPEKLNTVVGDRGSRLSGGERQRIALARALLRRPQLLLLDEATSALDWESQRLIANAIAQLRTTVVIIAHHPSMISLADWIVSVERGRVVEVGFLKDLLGTGRSQLARIEYVGEAVERTN